MLRWFLEGLLAPFASVQDFLDAGGWVVPWIFLAAVLLWGMSLERWWYFRTVFPLQRKQVEGEWAGRTDHRSWYARRIRTGLISELREAMEDSLPLIRVLVPLCPLLGLLGTVSGMLEVFDAMSASGRADTRVMAYGISHAMIATLAGLMVSLNALVLSGYFRNRVRVEAERLADLLGEPA